MAKLPCKTHIQTTDLENLSHSTYTCVPWSGFLIHDFNFSIQFCNKYFYIVLSCLYKTWLSVVMSWMDCWMSVEICFFYRLQIWIPPPPQLEIKTKLATPGKSGRTRSSSLKGGWRDKGLAEILSEFYNFEDSVKGELEDVKAMVKQLLHEVRKRNRGGDTTSFFWSGLSHGWRTRVSRNWCT